MKTLKLQNILRLKVCLGTMRKHTIKSSTTTTTTTTTWILGFRDRAS
jgi:hypothetical protein